MSHNKNIADYYDQTLNHYTNWWKLEKNLAVHYGIWDKNTRNFQDALSNTNKFVAKVAGVQNGETILDAGCGVGGSAFFLAIKYNAKVEGITLSEKQLKMATKVKSEADLKYVSFSLQDYCRTKFSDNSFDLIWAIESITSAPDKNNFAREAIRLLKPGGRLVIADYFRTDETRNEFLLDKWRNLWSMAPFLKIHEYCRIFEESGFQSTEIVDVTKEITPTAKRMYYSYIFGGPLAVLYNLFNTPTPFAKNHYKSGLYQYKALKNSLWKYLIVRFDKPTI